MLKVRQYLQPVVKDATTVEVVVKAYANFTGLAQACVKNGKLKGNVSLNQFVIGFNRRYPLFDFVDVGPGKEETDNKFKGMVSTSSIHVLVSLTKAFSDVLEVYVPNPLCKHIILGCYHDQGYIPFLRKFDQGPSVSEKITLLKTGPLARGMESLGFKKTELFNSLFSSESSGLTPTSPKFMKSLPVVGSERLGPIKRNSNGKRIDKDLSVDPKLLERMKKFNLCGWHYLREDCVHGHNRSHDYPRPLSLEEYDAVWYLTRAGGFCHNARGNRDCNDDRCIYRHRSS
jgi:hypothetical protein